MGYDLIINITELSMLIVGVGMIAKTAYDTGKLKQEVKDLKEIVMNWFKPKD
jgi:hypothetical protein